MTSDPPETDSLADRRRELESVDRSIVLLLAARLDAARRALRVRVAEERQLTDRAQERRVLLRSRGWAEELGLPPDLVEALFRSLMEEGKARFRSGEAGPDAPVVTVLLSPPGGASVHLGQNPHPQLVPVPATR